MIFGALVIVLGIFASYLAARVEWVAEAHWFRWGGLLVLISCTYLAFRSLGAFGPVHIFMSLVIAGSWMVFIAHFIGNTVALMSRSALGLDQLRVPPMFSRAEAAIARREYDVALQALLETAQEHPAEPEPRRRLAELYITLERYDDAVQSFRETAVREERPDEKLLYAFAAAEVLADRKGDLNGALQELETFKRQYPDVHGEEFLDQRITALRERINAVGGKA